MIPIAGAAETNSVGSYAAWRICALEALNGSSSTSISMLKMFMHVAAKVGSHGWRVKSPVDS